MFAKLFHEIVNISASDLDRRCVGPADFLRNPWFVPALLYQLEDFRAYNVEREHLAVTDIEKDSSILGSCTSN